MFCGVMCFAVKKLHITLLSPGDPYPNGRNQESSAEAIAAYEAVALYGLAASSAFARSTDPADQVTQECCKNSGYCIGYDLV